MSAGEALRLIGDLQWYGHSINAIVYSDYHGEEYEIALRLTADKRTITDISFKWLPRQRQRPNQAMQRTAGSFGSSLS
jgi:hypothetical protein